jgi:glycosyltransferase involved in cell wall biosynthesis
MKPRVLLIHNRYQERGGEDAVFETEAAMLARHGHEVETLEFDNAVIPERRSAAGAARLALNTIWSRPSAEQVGRTLRRFRPDVAHVHNFFPLVSPAAHAECAAAGVPVVQTLHNFRLICPNALLFRDGGPCHDCVGRAVPWPGVLHACYRDSRPQSAVVAAMLTAHRLRGTWRRDVALFIALTEFSRRLFIRGGFDPERVVVKPNVVTPDPGVRREAGDGFFFAGRLTESKGVPVLLDAWRLIGPAATLTVAGDGPLAGTVRAAAAAAGSIRYVGQLPRAGVTAELHRARALVFPSTWYETFGLSIVEAFAAGVPVIASRRGVMADIVTDGRTGLLFRAGDPADLAAKVAWATEHPDEMARMGQAAREVYVQRYSEEPNYRALAAIYARVCRVPAGAGE